MFAAKATKCPLPAKMSVEVPKVLEEVQNLDLFRTSFAHKGPGKLCYFGIRYTQKRGLLAQIHLLNGRGQAGTVALLEIRPVTPSVSLGK